MHASSMILAVVATLVTRAYSAPILLPTSATAPDIIAISPSGSPSPPELMIAYSTLPDVSVPTGDFIELTALACPGINEDFLSMKLAVTGNAFAGLATYLCLSLDRCNTNQNIASDESGSAVNIISTRATADPANPGYGIRIYGWGRYGDASLATVAYQVNDQRGAANNASLASVSEYVAQFPLCHGLAQALHGWVLVFEVNSPTFKWRFPDYAVTLIVSTDPLAQNRLCSNVDSGLPSCAFTFDAEHTPSVYATLVSNGAAVLSVGLTAKFIPPPAAAADAGGH